MRQISVVRPASCVMRTNCAYLIAGVLAFGLLAGCESFSGDRGSQATGVAPVARTHYALQGLPIPEGFTFDDTRSVFSANGQVRYGIYEYFGPADPLDIFKFYQDNMPRAGFALRQRNGDRGVYMLRFESDSEECDIKTMRDKGRTVINIRLGQRSAGAAADNRGNRVP